MITVAVVLTGDAEGPAGSAAHDAVAAAGADDASAFPSVRRRGESVVRDGVLVGVQIEALDAVVRPDGSTNPGFPLPVGTDFFLVEDLFNPDPASPRDPGSEAIGTGRTHCTVHPPQGLVISCAVTLEVPEGTLYGIETIDFRAVTPDQPLTADLAVTGGTADLIGATGECALSDREDHAASGISFYDCTIAQPRALVRQR